MPEANASIESVDRDQSALTRRTLLQAAGAVAVVAAAGGGTPQEALAEESDRFAAWRQSGHFGPRQIKNLETVWVTMRRWWDHWLKGIDTGIMSEPAYRAWMAESPVHHGMTEMPGRWVAQETWPSPRITARTWHLNNRTLGASAEKSAELVLEPTRQTVGIDSGHWCPGGGGENLATELALDQGTDDGRSLLFDSAPLEKRIEILGFPVVELDLAVDKPVALIAVRLNEVHPGGISRRVSYGVLNLTHRERHEHPLPLEPGKRYRVRVQLKDSGFAFKPGNRIRVSVSAANWYLVLHPRNR